MTAIFSAPYMPGEIALYRNAAEAFRALNDLYARQVGYLRHHFDLFVAGHNPAARITACYPYVSVSVANAQPINPALKSYGFVHSAGKFRTTITRPDLFPHYLQQQFDLLLANHNVPLEIGISEEPIPLHFALGEGQIFSAEMSAQRQHMIAHYFDAPSLARIDDTIANGDYIHPDGAQPLSLFTAPRTDLSLQRLRHYTGTSPTHFQNFVMFTNYQFYVDEFVKFGREMMQAADDDVTRIYRQQYTEFVEPGNVVTTNQNNGGGDTTGTPAPRAPQMPAYHLKRGDDNGITLVNIGVGPSNAKTITDHVAVMRPHVWLMLGHCAGLRAEQNMGDYVLAHAYVREDKVLDRDLPRDLPLPALAEVQLALEAATREITGLSGLDLKRIMRTGTVATVDDRNWEMRPQPNLFKWINQTRAMALDMESATIAANGYRFRVPYGTLLCVSDKPLHGHLKLPGMADQFYRQRVHQHLQIGIRTMELLHEGGFDRLHSRKLRGFAEPAFR